MPTTKETAVRNQAGAAPTAPFEQHRSLLLGLAYRLLGSMWDAEDVVQEAYVRWTRADRSSIREPRAFLITVVSRLALDQLKSARASREVYVGPWLPEPVATGSARAAGHDRIARHRRVRHFAPDGAAVAA